MFAGDELLDGRLHCELLTQPMMIQTRTCKQSTRVKIEKFHLVRNRWHALIARLRKVSLLGESDKTEKFAC